jgi:hypothetical protein
MKNQMRCLEMRRMEISIEYHYSRQCSSGGSTVQGAPDISGDQGANLKQNSFSECRNLEIVWCKAGLFTLFSKELRRLEYGF